MLTRPNEMAPFQMARGMDLRSLPPQFALGLQPVLDVVPVRAAPCHVDLVRAPGDRLACQASLSRLFERRGHAGVIVGCRCGRVGRCRLFRGRAPLGSAPRAGLSSPRTLRHVVSSSSVWVDRSHTLLAMRKPLVEAVPGTRLATAAGGIKNGGLMSADRKHKRNRKPNERREAAAASFSGDIGGGGSSADADLGRGGTTTPTGGVAGTTSTDQPTGARGLPEPPRELPRTATEMTPGIPAGS